MNYHKIQKYIVPVTALTSFLLTYYLARAGMITAIQYKTGFLILLGLAFLCSFVLSLITGESMAKGMVLHRDQHRAAYNFSRGVDLLAAIACFAIAAYWLV